MATSFLNIPAELVSNIGTYLTFAEKVVATSAHKAFSTIHAQSKRHTWVMAPHPGKSAVDRLRLLLARMPLLDELVVTCTDVDDMDPWEVGDEFARVFGCMQSRRIILTMNIVDATAQADNTFTRLLLRPFTQGRVPVHVSVSQAVLCTGNACKELLMSELPIDRLYMSSLSNDDLYGIKDALSQAASKNHRIEHLSITSTHDTSMWDWPEFTNALRAIPNVCWTADYECSAEDAGKGALHCTIMHTNRYITYTTHCGLFLKSIADASRHPDARIKQLVLGHAPTSEILRRNDIMEQLRFPALRTGVDIILTGDSIDSGTAAFIVRILQDKRRKIGIVRPERTAYPVLYARSYLAVIRAIKVINIKEMNDRFFVMGYFANTDTVEKMLGILHEDERALWRMY